jgi:hypothetical protein
MRNTRRLMLGIAAVAVLAAGIVVLAGNGFGENDGGYQNQAGSTSACQCEASRDADGDGIPNGQDPDWTRPLDGTGYQGGAGCGCASGSNAGCAFYGSNNNVGDCGACSGANRLGSGYGFGSSAGCPKR